MACYDGFGNLADKRPFFTGDFNGDGKSEILFYSPGDGNWWLGTFAGNTINWALAGNTSGFGNLADGRPIWVGDFAGTGKTDILFYYPADRNWWLGQFNNANQLTWNLAGNTTGFGQVWDGRPFWIGDFNGNGKVDVLFYFPGDSNWWLGSFNGNQLQWSLAGNTAGFGRLSDGRPIWVGDFAGTGKTDILFYYPGDRNWWLGQFNNTNQLTWNLAGNTAGFGQVWDGRPFWIGDFNGGGKADVLFYFPGDGNWWLGTFGGNLLQWNLAGNTGRPYHSRLGLHFKILTTPTVSIDTMLSEMREVYKSANIRVDLISTENLNLPALNDVDVGTCTAGNTTDEQNQLFASRNNVGANDVVVYFVRSTVPPSNGCAAHPADRPGAVIARGATQWTLAHEVGHVLGLNHVNDNNRLMTGNGTGNITNPPPDLIQSEISTMDNSNLTLTC